MTIEMPAVEQTRSVGPRNRVLDGGAHWRHLASARANTLDRPILHHAAKFRALQKRVVHFNAKFCTDRPYIAEISQFLKYLSCET